MQELTVLEKDNIESMIYEIRGKQVMLSSDVAKLYHSEAKIINQVVKRNQNRFPLDFCFHLTMEEWLILRSQNVTSSYERNKVMHGGIRYLPYAFTEHGIIMLSGLLKSDIAISVNIQVINAFIRLRKYASNNLLDQKYIHNQVLKNTEDIRLLQESFSKLEEKKKVNEIYFDGQIYDAYSKILDIFNEAKSELIVVDSYIDKTFLDIIRNLKIPAKVITSGKSKLTKMDVDKYNSQYTNLEIIYDNTFHDRYFILDKKKVYHCGTSLNYLGRKTFSINKIEDEVVIMFLIKKISTLFK